MTWTFAVAMAACMAVAARAETVRVTVAGHYEYVGAAPSPTADFTLSFTLDRQPPVCGGGEGSVIACGVSLPTYDNGALHAVLGSSNLQLRDAAHKGGLELHQDYSDPNGVTLNRLGFVIGGPQLWTGSLAAPTLVDGVYDLCPAHQGQVHPEFMGELCSYAAQSFASGDPINNPFFDPVTYQSDDPILSGTITIAAEPVAGVAPSSVLGELRLSRPTPNPAAGVSRVAFALAQTRRVQAAVIDVNGRQVRDLANTTFAAGAHELAWDGRDDAGHRSEPGVYFVRIDAEGLSKVTRLTRLR